MADIDLENRDPNNINDHLKVQFEDVLAEPEGIRSIPCIWTLSYKCFEFGKSICYKILTTFCGLCIALGLGCDFAMVAFDHVWIWTPCMRDFTICVGCYQKIFTTLVNCCCTPICEACGGFFSKIRIQKS
ncbi:caveolin-1-like [Ruditapes philippinarum]|uniref:caveolin-1-like n=1 Tax=Ruditapes philippinarum TaxID=129788 RepID=UPI00295AD41E|nr:caveolin-1-like [Ruditapes philippinarum]